MQFPQAKVKMNADAKFLESFGSNHIHMVTGNYVEELRYFCTLTGINYEIY